MIKEKRQKLNDQAEKGWLLPNGCCLYWKINEAGGRTYYSDECGIVSEVWDTALIDQSTLLAALTKEAEIKMLEYHERYNKEHL